MKVGYVSSLSFISVSQSTILCTYYLPLSGDLRKSVELETEENSGCLALSFGWCDLWLSAKVEYILYDA